MSYATKEIKRLMGKAIHTHKMIRDGDHVMVAVSGGKDSVALLWLLSERIKRIPIEYRITAVHVDPGFGANSAGQMESFFLGNGFPCFLCSRLRRKLLFELAAEIGCNRIAFGHHKDDLIETFFLNVFYGASISTMLPVQEFFEGEFTVIRPLYLVDEGMVRRYAQTMGWDEIKLG
ncbi:MAG: tRNA 2-thiocytidine(32) synthetase TtcA, partial [Deltaproteobacteria bacterium]|nr:tRNA 2-thiocytidine(32) synthetase TtcA [Deltaproteobacteria bacterium]